MSDEATPSPVVLVPKRGGFALIAGVPILTIPPINKPSGVFFFSGVSLPVAGFVVQFTAIYFRLAATERWNVSGTLNWTRKTTGTVSPRVTVGDANDDSPLYGQTPQVSLSSVNNWFSTFSFPNSIITNGTLALRNVHCSVGGLPAASAGNLPNW